MPVTGVEGNEREPSALSRRDIAGRRPLSARCSLQTTRIVHLRKEAAVPPPTVASTSSTAVEIVERG